MKKKIKLIKFIELRYADPISSIDLTDNYLLFGTMLGATKLYNINQNKLTILSEIQDEYISGVKIEENRLYICIGDVKILIYDLNRIPEYSEIQNYIEEDLDKYNINNNENNDKKDKKKESHDNNCDNCLTMLNNNYLIRTFIQFPTEPNEDPITKKTRFSIKNINNMDEIKGEIELSNYCVPFDFDGKNFIIIDFIKQNKRNYIAYDVDLKLENKFEIEDKYKDEKIGHISHLKIVKNDLLFIVRDYNICEMRKLNLQLKKKLNIKSKEILAFDIMLVNGKNKSEEVKENKSEEEDIEMSLYIIILDIDCNVFLYNYKTDKCELLFNLEKDDLGIDKTIKDQRFFLFGYPYYIKLTQEYIAISSDYGCILVQYSSF